MVNDLVTDDLITSLAAAGYLIVPAEPTIQMIEAGMRRGQRLSPKFVSDVIDRWRPYVGGPFAHEPGLVTAVRTANAAGALRHQGS